MDAFSTAMNYVTPVTNAVSSIAPLAMAFMGNSGGSNTTTSTTTPNYSYPTAQYLEGKRAQGTASAGKAKQTAYDNLARSLSVRGIGPNSPYSTRRFAGIEGSYLDSLASLQNKLLDLENTPTNLGSTTTTETPNTNNPLAMALGMMMYGKGNKGSGATTTNDPLDQYFNYAGTYNLNGG